MQRDLPKEENQYRYKTNEENIAGRGNENVSAILESIYIF